MPPKRAASDAALGALKVKKAREDRVAWIEYCMNSNNTTVGELMVKITQLTERVEKLEAQLAAKKE